MKTTKRILSLLLAMIMALSVTTAAFVSVSAAAPYVTRTRDVMPSPTFVVPDYIETYGTNEYVPGTKVKSIPEAIRFYLEGASNISFSCTGSVSLGTTYTSGLYTVASITSGTATANDKVEFVVSYTYNSKPYVSKAYSWVKPATNNGGVFMDWYEKKVVQSTAIGRIFTWASPTIGSFEYYVPSLVESGSGSGYMALSDSDYDFGYDNSSAAGQYKWYHRDDSTIGTEGSNSYDLSDTNRPTATYFVDVSQYQNLAQTPLRINIKHVGGSLDSSHWAYARGLWVESATLNGATTTEYAISGYSDYEMKDNTTVSSFGFSGILPPAGNTLVMETRAKYKIECKGVGTSSCTNTVKIKVKVVAFDKTELRNLVNSEKAQNRQQAHYNSSAWQLYSTAFANAYAVLGKPNAEQTEIAQAKTALESGIQSAQSGVVSANYTAVDRVLNNSIPADFNSHPEYYTTATRTALQQAIEDVNYDRALNVFYQSAVDQMALNLKNAAENLDYNSYTITFNCLGGTYQAPISQKYKTSVQQPETTTSRGGYVFAGWYYDQACSDPVVWPISMPYSGLTLYASWSLDTTYINFNTNGGSSIESATVNVGQSYGGPGVEPTKKGYDFAGWYYDAAFANRVEFPIMNIPQGGYTLYAKWTPALFYITFRSNGGSNVNAIAAFFGDSVDAPPDPAYTGHNFVAWYSDETLKKKVTWPMTMPSENVTLYAKWTTDNFRITFDSDGGTEIPEVTYDVGAAITAPTAPTKPGYNFLYWTYAGVEFQFTTMPPMNITLKAAWDPITYTIYFDTLGGSLVAPITQPCGTVVAAPEDPVLEGYLFRGWLLNGEPFTFTTMPAYGANLVAKWIEIPDIANIKVRTDLPEGTTTLEQGTVFTVTLSMKTNFYCGASSFIIFYDKRYFAPAKDGALYPTAIAGNNNILKNGFITQIDNLNGEIGWNLWQTADQTKITGRVNSYAIAYYPPSWRASGALLPEYANYDFIQVQYLMNNASPSEGTVITVDPEQDICSFQMMVKDDAQLTSEGDLAKIIMPREAIKGIDGTAASNGNKIYVNPLSDNVYSSPKSTRVLEYELEGDFSFNIVERSVKPTHTITFDSAGGSPVESIVAEETRLVQAPSAPSWIYHTFDGWYLDGELVTWPLTMPENDITLVAHWIAQTADYKVLHYRQNATGIGYSLADTETFNAVVGSEVVAQPNTYTGFYYFADNSETTGNVLPDGSLELKMRYLRNVSTLTFNSVGGTDVAPITQRYATEVTPPTAPTKTGFNFKGWTPELPVFMPAEDMSFTAVWEPKLYSITFILNNEVISSENLPYGDTIVIPQVTVPEGKVFSGWSPEVPKTVPATDMIFTASLDEGGFAVKFILDGVQISSSKVMEGGAIVIPEYVVPEGYKFNGWSPTVPSVMPTPGSDLTFTGTTSKKRNTLTFYLDSGDGQYYVYQTITRLYGASYEVPEPYVDEGWSFSGWSPAATGVVPADSTDYYGRLVPAQYTYRFYINGELVKTITGPVNTAVSAPEIPSQGYTFSGWSPAVPTSIGGSDQDFYATLQVKQYSIYFYINSELRADLTITQDYGTPVTAPVISEPNYTFSGWSPEVPETMPANNISVYATLTPSTGIVTFDANGAIGIVPNSISGIIGEEIDLPDQGSLKMTNFRFLGWNTDKDAKKALESYTITEVSAVLYAIWRDTSEDEIALVAEDEDIYIDAKRSYIYGIPEGITKASLSNLLLVSGEGYIEIQSAVGRYAGTGTLVYLYDNNDTLLHTYTVIVFGDLDGNGKVTTSDISYAMRGLSEGFEFLADGEYADIYDFAANIVVQSARDKFNMADISAMWTAVSDGDFSQVDLAQIYEYYEW